MTKHIKLAGYTPIPARSQGSGKHTSYPWDQMKVNGQPFFFRKGTILSTATSMAVRAAHAKKRNGWKFAVRIMTDEKGKRKIGCWRVR